MKFGVYFSFRNPAQWRRPWEDVYRETLGQIALAEVLGYDAVWLTEHHFVDDGYSPSVLPLAAAAAVQTRRVDIGLFIALLPLYHPVRLAEDAATVDVLSGGRLILGLSGGYREAEFRGLGIPFAERGARADEALEILHGCWEQEPFSYSGRHFQLENVVLRPRPVQRPHPRLFYGGGSPAGFRRAQWVAQHMNAVPEPQLTWLYVGADAASAWDECAPYARHVYDQYRRWTLEAGHPDWWSPDPRDHFLAGDSDFAVRAIEQRLGGFRRPPESLAEGEEEHIVLGMPLPGLPDALVRASLERFANDVMPHFRPRRPAPSDNP